MSGPRVKSLTIYWGIKTIINYSMKEFLRLSESFSDFLPQQRDEQAQKCLLIIWLFLTTRNKNEKTRGKSFECIAARHVQIDLELREPTTSQASLAMSNWMVDEWFSAWAKTVETERCARCRQFPLWRHRPFFVCFEIFSASRPHEASHENFIYFAFEIPMCLPRVALKMNINKMKGIQSFERLGGSVLCRYCSRFYGDFVSLVGMKLD